MSNGEPTTYRVVAPRPTDEPAATTSADEKPSSTTTYTFSRTGQPAPVSTNFPVCNDDSVTFCQPQNMSDLYVGKTYYATWNPDKFPLNSTVTVKVLWANDSSQQTWSSDPTDNSWGFVSVDMKKDWMLGYNMYNLTFQALVFEGDSPSKKAEAYEGPQITLKNEPPRHLEPSPQTKVNKEGLMIGLPIGLGFVLIVVVGLLWGMKKHRTIGLGNIMGRRSKGYGAGKSRRQRLGLGKKGAIRLEEREAQSGGVYSDAGHGHRDSLGSLVSDDDIRPAPGGNHFRDEVQRQRTGR
ncbi:hypothetical protein BS50DRAFT_155671 [Corynespora cassiicola Philippines]|uniref:Uncharacterized protein n=1 Tax=Corynespora cassiicola Philippines TaxID=1448308 RepID=A0A2T2N6W6_CORCC|nr:hypothetical protein BS50DRAFT_155671 [Corynespora cassiicola Philippines]